MRRSYYYSRLVKDAHGGVMAYENGATAPTWWDGLMKVLSMPTDGVFLELNGEWRARTTTAFLTVPASDLTCRIVA